PLILLSLYFFVGLYHLLLFLRRPQEKYNFYFFIFCVFLAVYLFTRSATVFSVMENYIVIARWELFTLFWAISFIIFFIDQILVGYITKFVKAYTAFSISLGLLIWITPLAAQEDVLRIWQASAPIFLVYVLYRVPKATLQEFRSFRVENKRLVESIRLTLLWTVPGNILLGILISVGTATFDILDSVLWHTGIALTKYGFFVFVMGIATALANRFLTVHKQVEELNRTLEQKVEERTRELKETLDRVNALKVKQDGDYYLTSLLIKPLSVTKFNSHWVKGDSFIRQKTHFQFRKWQTEIGGDINIADTIELRGEKYIVFANADAMGKSIQGAGGALVFGVVLNAIIKRTHLVASAKNVTPEAWLESCFLELQQMFVSFDGSMLISAVVGLVHERSGALYYFNAEHPFPVLVRDQKAEFLHDEMQLRKIGIVEIESMFRVLTFQLKKNDILILGSDGRDDIIIQTEDGAHMNEDETLFLRHVEKANADLNKLYEVIAESGEITDDLSLLKISYLPETDKPIYANESHILSHLQSAKEKWKQNTDFREIGLKEIYKQIMEEGTGAHAFTEVIRFCLSVKKEEAASWALELAERALVEYPTQSELLYLAAVAAVYNGQYKKAIEFGETFRRRDPEHIRNLVNLADAYRKIGQKKRAMNILDKLLEMAPEDELVIKLKKVLTK
ncbi:MAG: stage II sporulation protein E, partial [Candidatus Hydrogenedentota bacterium]